MISAALAPAARPRAVATWLFVVATWLFVVAALVFVMVVVGGITRLTESGLSMVRWEPVSGILPPLNAADWQAEFAAYKASPQYRLVNAGMTLAEFQGIYFWEYVHRLLGRFIGVAFALPLAWFALRRAIPRGYGLPLVGLLALGGMQGVVGWWMVASGLVDDPAVAHERLATHLTLALVIMAATLWVALDLRRGKPAEQGSRPTAWIVPFLALLLVQIVLGAFVAGMRAGYIFNTWPLMGETFAPPGLDALTPLWRNALDNPVAVQFLHRCTAYAVALYALVVAWRLWTAGSPALAFALAGVVALQVVLGILTVVHGVPIALGVLHQAGAALLLGVTVAAAHWCWQGRERSVASTAVGMPQPRTVA